MSKNFKHLALLTLLVFALCQISESASLTKDDDDKISSTNEQIPVDEIRPDGVNMEKSTDHHRTKRTSNRYDYNQIRIPSAYLHYYTSPIIVLGISPSVTLFSFVYKETSVSTHFDGNQKLPQQPGGQFPGGTPYPGGAQNSGGTEKPKVQFNATRLGGEDSDDDKITFMDYDDNRYGPPLVNNNLPIRPNPATSVPPKDPPANDFQAKNYNTLTGISLEIVKPSRPDSRKPPPIDHVPSPSSFRGKREVPSVTRRHLARGPTGGDCGDCKPI